MELKTACGRRSTWSWWCGLLLGLLLLATTLQNVQGEEDESEAPMQCRPFIEKALKEQQKPEDEVAPADESESAATPDEDDDEATTTTLSAEAPADAGESAETQQDEAAPEVSDETAETAEQSDAASVEQEGGSVEEAPAESLEEEQMQGDQPAVEEQEEEKEVEDEVAAATSVKTQEEIKEESVEGGDDTVAEAGIGESVESKEEPAAESQETQAAETGSQEAAGAESTETAEAESIETGAESAETGAESVETGAESVETGAESVESQESAAAEEETGAESAEAQPAEEEAATDEAPAESVEEPTAESVEEPTEPASEPAAESVETAEQSVEAAEPTEEAASVESVEEVKEEAAEQEEAPASTEAEPTKEGEASVEAESEAEAVPKEAETAEEEPAAAEESKESLPEEDLILEIEIPEELRPRDHVDQLLKLDDSNDKAELAIHKLNDLTLKELKRLYENAIKPLETLYKYRDLSNRHFGDSEIFSKPLVVFMGPWSGGKSSIINYLLNNEYNATSLRTGAEPSPAYFNLLMYGDEPEVLDGTQLAADFTFAGLQKFGQGLEERLRGLKLPNKLLEKINIVEIPGILEVRKQVSRVFPFNDACQWFIDRADIIFLVYDPSKLDVGPETEAILDQLKGREHQTRIVLNKADQVKPEELMRVQSALIWNISPLMSSAQPPVMYTTSLWSRPYETWAPIRLLQAQERAFLRDLRTAVDKRIENKISSARRFAVRVRNHAKMVDCYLTTYYNHKSVFGNRKLVADQIIDHPQDYHIYEGLSTLTNISRYDLPDPEVYRDFFRLNPLYDFQQLSATCTYFRGCPINRLDVAIAYDLPEMVGKHKKLVENALAQVKAADGS